MLWILVVVGIVLLAVTLWLGLSYNGLVTLRQRMLNAFAQIDVQLKRRYDLIPNLVETVKGYMSHERETLERVIAARNTASAASDAANAKDPASVTRLLAAESTLASTLGQLRVTMEAYPQLQAAANTGRLMEELSSTENRIAFARQAYNDGVMRYNTQRQVFPTKLAASIFGFAPATLFEVQAFERENVKVDVSAANAATAQ